MVCKWTRRKDWYGCWKDWCFLWIEKGIDLDLDGSKGLRRIGCFLKSLDEKGYGVYLIGKRETDKEDDAFGSKR